MKNVRKIVSKNLIKKIKYLKGKNFFNFLHILLGTWKVNNILKHILKIANFCETEI